MTWVVRAGITAMPAVRAIRDAVFVAEQGVDPAVEHDHLDASAVHLLAYDAGEPVGAARLVPSDVGTRIGRMAVVGAHRGRGVGRALLRTAEAVAARDGGPVAVELHAQLQAAGFYARLGYRPVGQPYAETGIAHVTMTRTVPGIRPARDADAAGLEALVAACWSAYPGCVLDVDAEEPWMRRPATSYLAWGGALWVVPGPDGTVAASVGLRPGKGADWELKTLYVAERHRRTGLAERLVRLVDAEAAARGGRALELWTDTRFGAAHRLYAATGWRATGAHRQLHDISETTEERFEKSLHDVP